MGQVEDRLSNPCIWALLALCVKSSQFLWHDLSLLWCGSAQWMWNVRPSLSSIASKPRTEIVSLMQRGLLCSGLGRISSISSSWSPLLEQAQASPKFIIKTMSKFEKFLPKFYYLSQKQHLSLGARREKSRVRWPDSSCNHPPTPHRTPTKCSILPALMPFDATTLPSLPHPSLRLIPSR
jgi:hypothetical protein